ncbi:hypothetical protein KIPE111705_11885 [Kibdelosporangium persicum]|uniref:hypothetical protein n=1 Tax=Kibdelosporangium persicum TaxID=2698649 RepID=UPI001565ECA0|nr:hypothetical protein [Kibdelosporangium persicum]
MTDTPANLPQWSIVLIDHLQILSTVPKEIASRLPADPDELFTAEQLAELFQLSACTLKDQAGAATTSCHADERSAAVGTYGVLPVATRGSSGHFISRLPWSDADDEGAHEC